MGYWVRQKEGVEQDEQGSATHFLHKREKEVRKKNREKKENESS